MIGTLDAFGSPVTAANYMINSFVPGSLTVTLGGPAQNFSMALSIRALPYSRDASVKPGLR